MPSPGMIRESLSMSSRGVSSRSWKCVWASSPGSRRSRSSNLLRPDQKWKKSSMGRTAGCAASRMTASDEVSVARWVDVRVNSIIAVSPCSCAMSPASRMQSGVAAKSSAVTGRCVTDGE